MEEKKLNNKTCRKRAHSITKIYQGQSPIKNGFFAKGGSLIINIRIDNKIKGKINQY